MIDARFSAGLMNLAVAGRYLHIPRQTSIVGRAGTSVASRSSTSNPAVTTGSP
jgi:hypothetical protein